MHNYDLIKEEVFPDDYDNPHFHSSIYHITFANNKVLVVLDQVGLDD